jgi:hypothetical protein
MTYESNRKFADSHTPQIKDILRECAQVVVDISVASEREDFNEVTDYKINVINPKDSVGCRTRGDKYFLEHPDFTLRSFVPSGERTELSKVKGGFPRWYLCCWSVNGWIDKWIFVDMDKFRSFRIKYPDDERIPTRDGSAFDAYSIAKMYGDGSIVKFSPSIQQYFKSCGVFKEQSTLF